MPYELNWLVRNKILEMRLIGDCAEDELQEVYEKHLEIVREEGIVPVHVILDTSDLTALHVKLTDMSQFMDISAADLFGWTIIVTENSFMKFLTTIFSKLTGSQFKTVNSYNEALAVLRKQVPEFDLEPL